MDPVSGGEKWKEVEGRERDVEGKVSQREREVE